MKRIDPISVIECAYSLQCSSTEWLEALAGMFSQAFGSKQGGLAFLYDASSGDWVHINGIGLHGLPAEFARQLFDQPGLGRDKAVQLAHAFATIRFGSMLETVGAISPVFGELLAKYRIGDMLVVNALDPGQLGCTVVVADRVRSYSPRTVGMCQRIAAHIAAGNRLRRTLMSLQPEGQDVASAAEAVLSPTGRFEHAVGPAKRESAREALRDGLVKIDAARSRKDTPEKGVELWRGLVSGRWSLVEHFERDGRRYYLAHRNDPQLPRENGLTRRERQVLAYSELGSSNKLIAYSLGISVSTVSTLLSRARRKLGSELSGT